MEDATLVIPGHGPATTIGDEAAANPFVRRKRR
jgi:glyoxylase-like metal-dependent hydrolase (beta-lactamase superfamily II)